MAAQALGHLVAHSGQSMSDIVERQVCVGVILSVELKQRFAKAGAWTLPEKAGTYTIRLIYT